MPKPILLLIVIAVVSATGSAFVQVAEQADTGSRSDKSSLSKTVEQLQGRWKSARSAYDHAQQYEGLTVLFKGEKAFEIGQVGGKEQPENEAMEVKFTVDESKTPMWIDFGKRKGIFRIDGDTLIVCIGESNRPTMFDLMCFPRCYANIPDDADPPNPDLDVPGWPANEFDISWDVEALWIFKKKTP